MDFTEHFPIWDKLSKEQQEILAQTTVPRKVTKGTILHNGATTCIGLLLIRSGQLRAYIISDEGREVTLYRLFERDICLFSASCMLNSLQCDLTIEAEKDSEVWVIPPEIYRKLMETSIAVAGYTNQLMATRLSEVMWLIEQVMWKSFDKRLADFLLEESNLEETTVLKITHEKIAQHLGTAREVVTRMLRHFQNEGMVKLTRGPVEILETRQLRLL